MSNHLIHQDKSRMTGKSNRFGWKKEAILGSMAPLTAATVASLQLYSQLPNRCISPTTDLGLKGVVTQPVIHLNFLCLHPAKWLIDFLLKPQ